MKKILLSIVLVGTGQFGYVHEGVRKLWLQESQSEEKQVYICYALSRI